MVINCGLVYHIPCKVNKTSAKNKINSFFFSKWCQWCQWCQRCCARAHIGYYIYNINISFPLMVSLFFFLLYISVININLCQPPSTTTFSKKTSGTIGNIGTIGTKWQGLQPAEMLKTEMHKSAKVCQKALFSKKRHFNT